MISLSSTSRPDYLFPLPFERGCRSVPRVPPGCPPHYCLIKWPVNELGHWYDAGLQRLGCQKSWLSFCNNRVCLKVVRVRGRLHGADGTSSNFGFPYEPNWFLQGVRLNWEDSPIVGVRTTTTSYLLTAFCWSLGMLFCVPAFDAAHADF